MGAITVSADDVNKVEARLVQGRQHIDKRLTLRVLALIHELVKPVKAA